MTTRSAVQLLAAARLSAKPMAQLPEALSPSSLAQAYQLQEAVNRELGAAGLGKTVGQKIGCTTTVMQRYLSIDHPCAGGLLESGLREGHGHFRRLELCRPGVECEIAVELNTDLLRPPDGRRFDAEGVEGAVAAAFASIELVDDRWLDFTKVTVPGLVADNFFAAGCVLGRPRKQLAKALRQAQGRMKVNGQEVGSGRGSDILGDPLAALAWLADHRLALGTPLRAGEVVTLGSLVKTVWIEAGDRVEVEIEELGGCSLELT